MHTFESMNQSGEFVDLLTNIKKGLETYSIKELNAALLEAFEKRDIKSVKKNQVIDAVCSVFQCSKRILLNSKFKGNNRLPACVLIVYLNSELDFSHRYISSNVFNQKDTSYSNIHRIISSHKKLNPEKIKYDADFLMYYKKVKDIVNGS